MLPGITSLFYQFLLINRNNIYDAEVGGSRRTGFGDVYFTCCLLFGNLATVFAFVVHHALWVPA